MNFFARLFGGRGRSREPVLDEVMGTLVWDDELLAWKSSALIARRFTITLPGDEKPEPSCLVFAREIQLQADNFVGRIQSEIEREARRRPEIAEFILGLRIDSVDLSGERNGMVFFEGEEDGPVWRMDLVDGIPGNLACDS